MPNDGGDEAHVSFTSNTDWSVSMQETKAVPTWLHVEPMSGKAGSVTLSVSTDPNDTEDDREAEVTISAGTVTKSFKVFQKGTPKPVIPAASIELNMQYLELPLKETFQLTATILPEDATERTVTWSLGEEFAEMHSITVSPDGLVTAVAEGHGMVVATCGEAMARCYVEVVIKPESIVLDASTLELMVHEQEALSATINPENASMAGIDWDTSNEKVVSLSGSSAWQRQLTAVGEGEATITATIRYTNISTTCKVTVKPFEIKTVDLGLSVYWSNGNLGATAPEAAGGFYCWGSLKPFTYITYDDIPYYNPKWDTKDGDGTFTYYPNYHYTKYNNIDKKTVLEVSDDAATSALGEGWSIPTEEQWKELLDNCDFKWDTVFDVKGARFTSKINGKSIFLPAVGDLDLYASSPSRVGQWSYYQSSTIDKTKDNHDNIRCDRSALFYVYSTSPYMSMGDREDGHQIRAVRKK